MRRRLSSSFFYFFSINQLKKRISNSLPSFTIWNSRQALIFGINIFGLFFWMIVVHLPWRTGYHETIDAIGLRDKCNPHPPSSPFYLWTPIALELTIFFSFIQYKQFCLNNFVAPNSQRWAESSWRALYRWICAEHRKTSRIRSGGGQPYPRKFEGRDSHSRSCQNNYFRSRCRSEISKWLLVRGQSIEIVLKIFALNRINSICDVSVS